MGSASGKKTMVFNPRERAISPDLNRLQLFGGFDLATLLAYAFDFNASDTATSSGFGNVGTSTQSPMLGQIVAGLTVKPQIASTSTLVDPGILIVCNPDASPNPDDSPYKLVNDPGVTNGATLPLVPNASGSTQIHVVECSRTDVVLESDNRDVFDPATGLFAPALVNKVIASRLTYRIRVMTLAGGLTTASGWLPLAVALVPNGALTWDDCPFVWDVRPLIADRSQTPFGRSTTDASKVLMNDASLVPGTDHLRGRVEAVGRSGRKLGGDLAHSPADTFLDLSSSEVRASGFAAASGTPYYLYLCEPYGLPRWCRYSAVAAGYRLPGRLRGMPVLSAAALPGPVTNQNGNGILSPSAFGFPGTLVTATNGVCVWAGMFDNSPATIKRGVSDGWTFWQLCNTTPVVATAKTVNDATFTLTPGTHFPNNAREVEVKFEALFGGGAAGGVSNIAQQLEVQDGSGGVVSIPWSDEGDVETGDVYDVVATCRIPVACPYPSAGVLNTVCRLLFNGALAGYGAAPTIAIATVQGWAF